MVGKNGRTFLLFWVSLFFVFLLSLIGLNRAHADRHFWAELGVVKFDKKLTAPTFTLKDLNGKGVKLEDHRGKVVFLNFWATWCLPCREEMPSVEKLYSEFKDKDFTIVGWGMSFDVPRLKQA